MDYLSLKKNDWGTSHLKCPKCGQTNLHQEVVNTIMRPEDKNGILTKVEPDGTTTVTKINKGLIPGRRDVIIIGFDCEHCCDMFYLQIKQHKGDTEIFWMEEETVLPIWKIKSPM